MKKIFIVLTISLLMVGCGIKNERINSNSNNNSNSNKEVTSTKQSNLGYFVEYQGELYYWKLNSNSRSLTALFGNFSDSVNSYNELVKRDKDGNEKVLLKDKGSQDIVIVNDKLYTSYAIDDNSRMIYSINLDGTNKKEIGKGSIKYISEHQIIGSTKDNKIIAINLDNNEYKELVSNADLLMVKDDVIYYGELQNNIYTINSLKGTDKKSITTVTSNDFKSSGVTTLDFEKALVSDKQIDIYVGYRDGSAALLNGLVKVTISNDGKVSKEVVQDINESSFEDSPIYYRYDSSTRNSTLVYEDNTGKVFDIMDEGELSRKYNLAITDDLALYVYNGNAIGNDIYFIMDYDEHDSANDIGWRYSYTRKKTMYFKYNLSTKTLDKIYEF